jgi:hypothetical protein
MMPALLAEIPPTLPAGMSVGWLIALTALGTAAANAVITAVMTLLTTNAQRKWEIRKWETERREAHDSKVKRDRQKALEPLLDTLMHFQLLHRQEILHLQHGVHITPEDVLTLASRVEFSRLVVGSKKLRDLLDQISDQLREPVPNATTPEENEKRMQTIRTRQKVFEDALIEGIREYQEGPMPLAIKDPKK